MKLMQTTQQFKRYSNHLTFRKIWQNYFGSQQDKKLCRLGTIASITLFLLIGFNSTLLAQKKSEFPPITPYWALGHIVWEDNFNTQSSADSLVQEYINHHIPVDGIIIDSPWELHYNDFVWDKTKYPDPEKMLANFSSKNIHTLLWLTGNTNLTAVDIPGQKAPNFDYAIKNNYVITVNDSALLSWWKGRGVFIDFTNPEAVKWWNKQLDNVFIPGVYGWKVDNFELHNVADSLKSSVGMISERDFKKYYYNSMYDYTLKRNNEGIIFARPYSHQGGFNAIPSKLSVGWCGDFSGDWKGLKLQISNIYKSAKAGYGALACEVGGFNGAAANKQQLIRYSQFASMVATIDNGGANGAFTNHLPWFHDSETTRIYRDLILMHRAIRPYIFSSLVENHINGKTLINEISEKQESHKLGTDIFTKAITSDTTEVSFQLPKKGEWYNWWNGKKQNGGSIIKEEFPLNRFPLYISNGAILPLDINGMNCNKLKTDSKKTIILIYGISNKKVVYHKPTGDGTNYTDIKIKTKKNGKIKVKSEMEHNFVFIVKKAGTPLYPNENSCPFDILSGTKIISKTGKKFHTQKYD